MTDFADRLLAWYDRHGRHHLPWKESRDPYRVWVSEIMLQQTQVAAVLPYYRRFMESFPDVAALAAADLDDVLARWAGLGYYARARNLHRAARIIVDDHGGRFPTDLKAVMALPGVGRSTAGAILALASGARHAILDGNVKRVLSRVHRIGGDPGAAATVKRLWSLSEELTPNDRVDDYTQAIMDLGATACTRARPQCDACPVAALCAARAHGDVADYPARRARRARPRRTGRFLLLEDAQGRTLLERRPPAGIWGGLWCLPEIDSDPADWARRALGAELAELHEHPPFVHKFTHFDLEIRASSAMVERTCTIIGEALRWHTPSERAAAGMPAPFRKFIDAPNHLTDNRKPQTMAKTVHCAYLDREAEGLDRAPWPGELGQKVLDNISKDAWAEWMRYQTMLINEKRLNPMDKTHRKYLSEQMEKFLFKSGEVDAVSGFTPQAD